MPFMQDNGMYRVQLTDRGKLDFIYDGVDKKLEVFDGCGATIEVVGGGNGVNVRYFWAHSLQQGFSFLSSQSWNLLFRFAYFNDVTMILRKSFE